MSERERERQREREKERERERSTSSFTNNSHYQLDYNEKETLSSESDFFFFEKWLRLKKS